MGAVAMNMETFERIDLTECVDNEGLLTWQAPKGKWKLLSFFLEYNVDSRLDYMDKEAVDHFISMTYDQYSARFNEFFGKIVKRTFFDDVGYLGNSRYWNAELTAYLKNDIRKKLFYIILRYGTISGKKRRLLVWLFMDCALNLWGRVILKK